LATEESHSFGNPSTYEYTFGAEALFIKQFLLKNRSERIVGIPPF